MSPASDNLKLIWYLCVLRYGISQTLDRVFTAPNLVKKVMCDESRIQDAFIGDRSTQVRGLGEFGVLGSRWLAVQVAGLMAGGSPCRGPCAGCYAVVSPAASLLLPCCPLLQVEQLFRDCPRVQTVWTPDSSYKCAHLPAVALWL